MTIPEQAVELLPCPFCGSEAKVLTARVSEDCEEARVECTSCAAAGPADEDAYANHAAAASYWNRRAALPLVGVQRPEREEIARAICNSQKGRDYDALAEFAKDWWRTSADAVLALPHTGQPQEGWQLVPVEPTREMFESWRDAYDAAQIGSGTAWAWDDAYKAMLSATPASPQRAEGE